VFDFNQRAKGRRTSLGESSTTIIREISAMFNSGFSYPILAEANNSNINPSSSVVLTGQIK